LFSVRFFVQEVRSLLAVEDVVAAVNGLRSDSEPSQPVDRAAFLLDEAMRVLESRAVE